MSCPASSGDGDGGVTAVAAASVSLVLLESCYTRAGILLHRSPGASYVSPWDVFDASYPNWREEVSLQVWKTKTNLRKKGLGYLNMTFNDV